MPRAAKRAAVGCRRGGAAIAETVIIHPNRDKAESKATKAIIVLLLLTSAGLVAIITIGGWKVLQGAQPVAAAYAILLVVMAWYVARWNRGVLPVAAALAVLFAVVAGVSAPAWFARDKAGFQDPALAPSILGLLTVILIVVEVLLLAFSMRGFQQKWNVELEVHEDDGDLPRDGEAPGGPYGGEPEPAGA